MDIVVLAIAFVVILAGAELFTNGIEWFGRKLNLAQGAVGSVLAAVGTALPETMIPIIAIAFGGGGEATDAVGIGAILGAPFMLSTLAMFVTGVGVIFWRKRRASGTRMVVDTTVLVHDIRYFVLAYALAIATAFVPPEIGWVRGSCRGRPDRDLRGLREGPLRRRGGRGARTTTCAPLRFRRMDPAGHRRDPAVPRLRVVNLQVLFALACIIGGAYLFVGAVERLAHTLGVSEILLALVIAPIATELPEKFNSLIWVRQGKDTLAMGNITGRDGVPVGDPDGGRAGPRGRRVAHRRGHADRLPVGGHRVHRRRGDLRADVAAGAARRPVAARRRRAVPRLPRDRRPGDRRGAADRLRSAGAGGPRTPVLDWPRPRRPVATRRT